MPREPKVPRSEWGNVLFRGALPLSLPIVLLGGIYSGAFTPTEAAAVAALHALLLAGVVYRALSWRALFGVVLESTRSSAVITIVLAGSSCSTTPSPPRACRRRWRSGSTRWI